MEWKVILPLNKKYRVGDIVSDEGLVKIWLQMYDKPHVELIEDSKEPVIESSKPLPALETPIKKPKKLPKFI